jgi:hypothetical protein
VSANLTPSPSGSMAGFNLWTLLAKNKDKVKLFISALGTYLTQQAALIHNPTLNNLACAGIGVVIYGAACAVDYLVTTNPS